MYGTHHKTGKQIRLLQHTTSTWRSNKSLVWLNKYSDLTQPWNRIDVGIIGSQCYDYCSNNKIVPDIIVCTETEDIEWIVSGGYKKVNLLVASKAVLDAIGLQYLKDNNISNILCLDEFHLLYPFMGSKWDGSNEDACVLVGMLLRFGKMYNINKSNRYTYDLELFPNLPTLPKLTFITQYYLPKQAKRAKEVDVCLRKNVENQYIDEIVLLNESDLSNKYVNSSKITQVVINQRLYYDTVIRYINESVSKNTIVVFANADIYLDSTIRHLYSTNLDNKFLALLRYENGKIFGPRADSQDTWIITSDSVKERAAQWNYDSLHFSFGVSGCDNAITCEMLRMKYLVVNPALTIQTHHVHDSEIRTYDKDEIVDKNVYLYIEPTGLHDMEAVGTFPSNSICTKLSFESFNRPIVANKAPTYCKMLEKDKRYLFTPSGNNTFDKQSLPVYKFDSTFQTNHGLAYSYNKIYVGSSKVSQKMWADSRLSTLSPSVRVKKGYVAPLPEEQCRSRELYMLYYLPKILLLRNQFGNDGEFWCPNKKEFVEALQLFKWNTNKMPVLSQTDNESAFMDTAYVWFPTDNLEVSKEEMSVLREFLRDSSEEESVVVCMDELYISKDLVKELESKYENLKVVYQSTSLERKISAFQTASSMILYCSKTTEWAWRYIWAMKPNTNLVTVMNEMEMNGEIHHLANACQLNHTIHTVPKGVLSTSTKERILESLVEKDKEVVDIPTVYVPNPNTVPSFFKHKGDSFREIVDMWAERGYVKKEYADCKNVWMNGIGDTLLYDRPNYDWIKNADSKEQGWKRALFGNPKPIGNNSKSWSFWARRPRLVENMLTDVITKTKKIVFYGKIENQVQKNNRTRYDWSSVCDEYYMANENELPKFSEQEYLDKLAEAKYGLCLAGFGKKCHREVECMAFGTVPIVATEVDMDNYANPPIEGLHYIRVVSPEDLKYKLTQFDDDIWWRMSEACKKWYMENSSADGMWNITKKLINI
jgi:hypothetical protein